MAKLASTVLTYVGWAQTYQSFSVGDVEVLELPLESVGLYLMLPAAFSGGI